MAVTFTYTTKVVKSRKLMRDRDDATAGHKKEVICGLFNSSYVRFPSRYFVCLSVHSHISKNTRPNFSNFICMLFVAVAQSSSDGVVIRYALPVLWMTSFFHTDPVARHVYS